MLQHSNRGKLGCWIVLLRWCQSNPSRIGMILYLDKGKAGCCTFREARLLLRKQATMRRLETAPHLPAASLWLSPSAKTALRLPAHLKKGPRFDPVCDCPTNSMCRSSAGTFANRAASSDDVNCIAKYCGLHDIESTQKAHRCIR